MSFESAQQQDLLLLGKRISNRPCGCSAALNIIFFLLRRPYFAFSTSASANIQVERRIVFSGTGSIFPKDHIQIPVKLVYGRPVFAYCIGKFMNVRQRSNEIPCVFSDRIFFTHGYEPCRFHSDSSIFPTIFPFTLRQQGICTFYKTSAVFGKCFI